MCVPCFNRHLHVCIPIPSPSFFLTSRLPNILEYLREPLQAGLGDRSPYVRKTCVMGIVKLFHVAPEFVEGTCQGADPERNLPLAFQSPLIDTWLDC